ncbi:hypothetical protein HPY42_02940 [Coprothermobacteraceae bacterium]|nr:hypothetical protein [Coprothermobacteraceae bacterium]
MKSTLARIIEWIIALLLVMAVFTTISWSAFFDVISRPMVAIRSAVYQAGTSVSEWWWWNTKGRQVYEEQLKKNELALARSVTSAVRFGSVRVEGIRWDKTRLELICTGTVASVGDLVSTDTKLVVGQVVVVNKHSFVVRTIFDRGFAVPAFIARTGLVGRLFYHDDSLVFQPVGYQDIQVGDTIVVQTSTTLLVATVTDASDKQYVKARAILPDLRLYGLNLWKKTW